ncbi:hypothetical protein [Paraburkholderia sp. J12]|uniref:hypothetical protein n=1 Tax=Paraburkholderia sp. J12 TaxID=2805432 RepID=UPI002ABD6A03|nr:hypothetical protein [Paraburkholderia sp. J12]
MFENRGLGDRVAPIKVLSYAQRLDFVQWRWRRIEKFVQLGELKNVCPEPLGFSGQIAVLVVGLS